MKIRERHELILTIIEAFDEEKWAYEQACLLTWLLPLLVLVTSLADLLLLILYTYTLHPWAALLGENETKSKVSRVSKAGLYRSGLRSQPQYLGR